MDRRDQKASGNAFSVLEIKSVEMVTQKIRDTIDSALSTETGVRIFGSAGTISHADNGYTVSGKRTGRVLARSTAVDVLISDQ